VQCNHNALIATAQHAHTEQYCR